MEGALAWVLLLPQLLLQELSSQQTNCRVSSGNVNWTNEFTTSCLNFSGQHLSLPQNQSLRARNLKVLDLSRNNLRKLTPLFFAQLGKLKLLNVIDNPLEGVDSDLAARCDLELLADCRCALEPWNKVRQENCSDQQSLRCLSLHTHTWHNLSTFLETQCASGLTGTTIGALAAGGSLLLVLAITGLVLAWKLRERCVCRSQGPSKTWASQRASRPSSGQQPRYSSRGLSSQPPVTALPNRSSSDYENMFHGLPAPAGHQWAQQRPPSSEDSDFYMSYEGGDQASQPVYCNLQSLGRGPLGCALPDEEDYVMPGH